ncbi:MAG: hypothetical protein Q4P23_03295 [Micrococcaceae bacterium]|nr:hypothetical protein [Micrococcaceae bacterium]
MPQDRYIPDHAGGFGWAVPDGQVLDFIDDFEAGIGTYLLRPRDQRDDAALKTDPARAARGGLGGGLD